jgi:hypothetical protein
MSCSINRFKCSTTPEKIVNTENVKQINQDITKLLAERSSMDSKYFPKVQTTYTVSSLSETAYISHEDSSIYTKSTIKAKKE